MLDNQGNSLCTFGIKICPFVVFTNFNTFASQRLVFEEKNLPFLLENSSNLTHEFLYDNFNKKILLNLMHFQEEMVNFFPQKRGAEKRKC